MKVFKGLMLPASVNSSSTLNMSLSTAGPSPAKRTRGASTIALKILVYHESARALPPTTSKLCFITTECKAVIAELLTPKKMPTVEIGVPSRNTPIKNPMVTTLHDKRIRKDGREWRNIKDVQTVNGRRRPRATW